MPMPTQSDDVFTYTPRASGAPAPGTAAPPAPAAPRAGSEATRLLAIAAYTNAAFRRDVLDRVRRREHAATAPEYGVDLQTVAAHCAAADRRDRSFALWLILASIGGAAVVLATEVLIGAQNVVPALVTAWAVLAAIVFARDYSPRFGAIASGLSRRAFAGAPLPPASAQYAPLIARCGEQARQNLVVYSGFTPFVGAGVLVERWSFALNVTKGKRMLDGCCSPRPFAVHELYDCVEQSLVGLGLPHVTFDPVAYVNGRDVRDDRQLLPSPYAAPSVSIPAEQVHALTERADPRIRAYRCVQSTSWDGELVVTMFLRCVRQGSNLFVEVNKYLLPPIHESYHKVDALRKDARVGEMFGLGIVAVVLAPFSAAAAYLRATAALQERLGRRTAERERRRRIDDNLEYDYGAGKSVRETAASADYRRYFQRVDQEMHAKLLERQILEAVTDFLDAKDIDTAELIGRRDTILNTGVIVSQSKIEGDNVVLGGRATATMNSVKTAAQSVKTAAQSVTTAAA